MSVTKTESGRWNARFPKGDGTYGNKVFTKQSDAKAYESKMVELVQGGAVFDPKNGKKTVEEVAWTWYGLQPDTPNYRQNISSHLRNHLLANLGKRQIATVTEDDLQKLVRLLEKGDVKENRKPMAATTIRTVMTTINMVFRYARKKKWILEDPSLELKLPQIPQREIQPMTIQQVHLIADNIFPRYRGVVLFDAATGLRQGEVFAVRVEDINWTRGDGSVKVHKQIQSYTGRPQERQSKLKTARSYRTVPVDDDVLDLLEKHLIEFPSVGGYLFTNSIGKPLHRRVFDRAFDAAKRRAVQILKDGADEHLEGDPIKLQLAYAGADKLADEVFHSLRHFYASLLIRGGLSPKVVAARLGHSNAMMTLNRYSHLWPDDEGRTREATKILWVL